MSGSVRSVVAAVVLGGAFLAGLLTAHYSNAQAFEELDDVTVTDTSGFNAVLRGEVLNLTLPPEVQVRDINHRHIWLDIPEPTSRAAVAEYLAAATAVKPTDEAATTIMLGIVDGLPTEIHGDDAAQWRAINPLLDIAQPISGNIRVLQPTMEFGACFPMSSAAVVAGEGPEWEEMMSFQETLEQAAVQLEYSVHVRPCDAGTLR